MGDLAITQEGRLPPVTGDQNERLRLAAQQLEGTFLQILFQGLDQQSQDDEPLLGGGPAAEQFKGLYHSALCERSAGHLGIADTVVKELAARAGLRVPGQAPPPTTARP
jgi:Rod binding domain-containing protein